MNFDFPQISSEAGEVARAAMIVDLALMSLLVDKGVLTPNELIERLTGLYNRMDKAQCATAMVVVEGFIAELRAQPGATA